MGPWAAIVLKLRDLPGDSNVQGGLRTAAKSDGHFLEGVFCFVLFLHEG